MPLGALWLGTAMLAFAGGPHVLRHSPAPPPLLPQPLSHRVSASPVMMPSPLRFRQRVLSPLGSFARGVVVSTQNVLIEKTPYSRLVGVRYKPDLSGDDDDDEAPAVLSDEVCLVPGKPIVRVEKAPGNARRIFTGIDIVVEAPEVLEMVWATLTDYPNLADGIPNLVDNKVLELRENGARLEQVGGATLAPGITFTAKTTLDVTEYLDGLPSKMEADHLAPVDADVAGTDGADATAKDAKADAKAVRRYGAGLPLTKDIFPRPYIISSLPHRDITMQGVPGMGDFSFYQGVWRFQELPGCAPPGSSAMRLTYSVELSPSLWVPVALLEGNIAKALGENLEAIRDFVTAKVEVAGSQSR